MHRLSDVLYRILCIAVKLLIAGEEQKRFTEQEQIKVSAQAKKYEKVNSPKGEKIHLLSGILLLTRRGLFLA